MKIHLERLSLLRAVLWVGARRTGCNAMHASAGGPGERHGFLPGAAGCTENQSAAHFRPACWCARQYNHRLALTWDLGKARLWRWTANACSFIKQVESYNKAASGRPNGSRLSRLFSSSKLTPPQPAALATPSAPALTLDDILVNQSVSCFAACRCRDVSGAIRIGCTCTGCASSTQQRSTRHRCMHNPPYFCQCNRRGSSRVLCPLNLPLSPPCRTRFRHRC